MRNGHVSKHGKFVHCKIFETVLLMIMNTSNNLHPFKRGYKVYS